MKRVLPLIIAVFAFGRVAAQIPNGGFESWNTSENWIDPAGYLTSNDEDFIKIPGFAANVTQLPPWTQGEGYAVQLKTVAVDGDTLPAFITNSVNNPLQRVGGVPYTGKPTGIEAWLNCSETTGDTAGMIVVFKKSGSIIGTYIIPIAGPISGYPLKSYNFSPALTLTPDTVIFAATSSINILEGKNGFTGSTLALSEVEFVGASTPSDLNWDFDPWIGDTVFSPTGWTTLYPGASRTTDSYAGTYALELQTNSGGGNNAQPGFATTGKLGPNDTSIAGGFPYTGTTDTLEFYYKYTPAVTNTLDSGNVSVIFKLSGVPIGFAEQNLPAASGYTLFKLPVSLVIAPDSAIISFFSSLTDTGSASVADIGSTLEVDNLQFASQVTTGSKPVLIANNSLLIYPNPASSQLTISSVQTAINEVRLDNILRQTLIDKTYSSGVEELKENIDVSSLPSGMYFITITSGDKTSTGKIIVSNK